MRSVFSEVLSSQKGPFCLFFITHFVLIISVMATPSRYVVVFSPVLLLFLPRIVFFLASHNKVTLT